MFSGANDGRSPVTGHKGQTSDSFNSSPCRVRTTRRTAIKAKRKSIQRRRYRSCCGFLRDQRGVPEPFIAPRRLVPRSESTYSHIAAGSIQTVNADACPVFGCTCKDRPSYQRFKTPFGSTSRGRIERVHAAARWTTWAPCFRSADSDASSSSTRD